jgi:hypothetical protein
MDAGFKVLANKTFTDSSPGIVSSYAVFWDGILLLRLRSIDSLNMY